MNDPSGTSEPLAASVMQQIGELIRTQDNLATSDPMFLVQERVRIYGVGMNYTDSYEWVNDDGNVADEEYGKSLERRQEEGIGGEDPWTKTGYIDRWEFVTACFTRQGCERYIALNGHNLNTPRIYVASAYRNKEFIAVRKILMSAQQPIME